MSPRWSKLLCSALLSLQETQTILMWPYFRTVNNPICPWLWKYRKKTRAIASKIALNILPLKPGARDSIILDAIAQGEAIYENDTRGAWFCYAWENLSAAEILQSQRLYDPCLQNVQQSVEKSLEALLLEKARLTPNAKPFPLPSWFETWPNISSISV